MEIIISDRQEKKIDKQLVEELSRHVLNDLKAPDDAELSISLVSPDEMSKLNLKYRKINKPTDVLSFSFSEEPKYIKLLGDIVLCPEGAMSKAKKNKNDFSDYFALLIVHSILHLFDYSHGDDDGAKVMSEMESQLLKSFDFRSKAFL